MTQITNVTLQVVEGQNRFTVFTDYKNSNYTYDGFNVYDTLEEAKEAAIKLVNTWGNGFMSTVSGYTLKTFKECGDKITSFIKQ